jgi:hypothetical protein
MPDSYILTKPVIKLDNSFQKFNDAKNILDSYIRLCTQKNYPSPIQLLEQTKENHRRGMRALVDKLIESKFQKFYDSRIDIDVVGGYYTDGYYENFYNYRIDHGGDALDALDFDHVTVFATC